MANGVLQRIVFGSMFLFFGCTYEKARDCVAAEHASISEILSVIVSSQTWTSNG